MEKQNTNFFNRMTECILIQMYFLDYNKLCGFDVALDGELKMFKYC